MEEKCHLSHFFSPPVFSSAQKIPKVAYQYEEDRGPARADNDVYNSWLKSRTLPQNTGTLLAPGNHRPFDHTTLRLASRICKMCFPDILRLFFALHPWRTVLMIILQLVRGMLPVFKGFSHAVLIDEVGWLEVVNRLNFVLTMTGAIHDNIRKLLMAASCKISRYGSYKSGPRVYRGLHSVSDECILWTSLKS